tara:strand:- start:558 stop:869 length:312 start_codon:yes stop_codon:yes gene_type:complete
MNQSEEALTKMLRGMLVVGIGCDEVDSGALTEAGRTAQKGATWRKVAPFFAEAFIFHGSGERDAPTGEVLRRALCLWIEHQPKVSRELVERSYSGAEAFIDVQ